MTKNNESHFPYLHGFSQEEQDRLKYQAQFHEYSIYQDINFSSISKLLEVGCGVGGQSEILLRRFQKLHLTGIDLSPVQLDAAKKYLETVPYAKGRYELHQMDATKMKFAAESFDAAFICWILEHIPNPSRVLNELRRVLRKGGHVVISEVLNSSFFLDPYSPNVWKYWMSFNDYQYEIKGDPFVGAKLGNLLMSTGFKNIETKVKTFHYDNRMPELRKNMIEYWTDLLLSGADQLIKVGKVTKEIVDKAKEELEHVASDPNAVFFYSYIQARAEV